MGKPLTTDASVWPSIFADPSGNHRSEYYENRPGPAGATSVPVQTDATATVDAVLDPT